MIYVPLINCCSQGPLQGLFGILSAIGSAPQGPHGEMDGEP